MNKKKSVLFCKTKATMAVWAMFCVVAFALLVSVCSYRVPMRDAVDRIRGPRFLRRRRSLSMNSAANNLIISPPSYLMRLLSNEPLRSAPNNQSSPIAVTVADLVSRSGRAVELVQRDVLALASLTHARMQVQSNGDIRYLFPRNIERIALQRSLVLRLHHVWSQLLAPKLFQLYKLSFGLALYASLTITAVCLCLVLSSQEQQDNDSDDRRHRSHRDSQRRSKVSVHFPMYHSIHGHRGPSLHDFAIDLSSPFKSNPFLQHSYDTVYKFLFGDENPNRGIDDEWMRHAARIISESDGVVIAEQVVACLPSPPVDPQRLRQSDTAYDVDESWMLPLLLRFNGRPHVTPEGHIVYSFPELAKGTDSHSAETATTTQLDIPFEELRQTISPFLSPLLLFFVAVNFIGVRTLDRYLSLASADQAVRWSSPGWVLVRKILPVLRIYATGFVGIPIARMCWFMYVNSCIHKRNARRQQWLGNMAHPTTQLTAKLRSRMEFAKRLSQRDPSDHEIVYDTHSRTP